MEKSGTLQFFFLFEKNISLLSIKPDIMAWHNVHVIYVKAWCARDDPLDIGCTRYAKSN